MLQLIALVVVVGLADSLNPSTIGPALYLVTGERPRRRLIAYTASVFVVYLAGGAAIALGPGQLVISLVKKPGHDVRDVAEIIAGVVMIAVATILWARRERLSRKDPPVLEPDEKSSAALGATITAIELPTAFPYFAAIAAILGADLHPIAEIALLLLFNACFVLPLVAIIVVLGVAGDRATSILDRTRRFLQDQWPRVFAAVALAIGLGVVLLGSISLIA